MAAKKIETPIVPESEIWRETWRVKYQYLADALYDSVVSNPGAHGTSVGAKIKALLDVQNALTNLGTAEDEDIVAIAHKKIAGKLPVRTVGGGNVIPLKK